MPSKNVACVPNSEGTHDLDMETIAKAHESREKCLLKKVLGKITANVSCTPTIFKSFPKFSEFSTNTTVWCHKDLILDFHEMIIEIFTNFCPAPCSSIEYEYTMEPFHGALASSHFFCGGPSIVLYFSVTEKVEVTKVIKFHKKTIKLLTFLHICYINL